MIRNQRKEEISQETHGDRADQRDQEPHGDRADQREENSRLIISKPTNLQKKERSDLNCMLYHAILHVSHIFISHELKISHFRHA